jgi:membrane protein DedA with SNARE-associated domain
MNDWIRQFVEQTSYLGVMLLMLLENVFPPIPSEIIMPLAGYHAASGGPHIAGVIIAGTLGSLLGALLWYWVGKKLGLDRVLRFSRRHGRWLTLAPKDVSRVQRWFEKHCGKSVLLGRMVPTIRTLISIPAGIVEMPLGRFVLLTTIGSAIWTSGLALAGYALGAQYTVVERYLGPVTNVIFGAIVAAYLYRVATFDRKAHAY